MDKCNKIRHPVVWKSANAEGEVGKRMSQKETTLLSEYPRKRRKTQALLKSLEILDKISEIEICILVI